MKYTLEDFIADIIVVICIVTFGFSYWIEKLVVGSAAAVKQLWSMKR